MKILKVFTTSLVLLCLAHSAQAQYSGPRYFWDIPSFYLTAPDLANVSERTGLGLETTLNVATHWGTARLGGGAMVTVNPSSEKIAESFITTPYFLLEGGAGLYRTNGNHCAATHRAAFTAMPVLGVRYDINTQDLISATEQDLYGFNFLMGVELGYFFIRDIVRNTEVVLRGNYYPGNGNVSLNLGFKFFLNMRELGRY